MQAPSKYRENQTIPWPLHVMIIGGLVTVGALLMSAISRDGEVPLLLVIPVLVAVYWRLRRHPIGVACYFGIAIAAFTWIVLCESIVQIDKSLGTRVSQQLRLGPRLTAYVASSLPTEDHREVEPCCGDALMWRYRPGSRYRSTFDCPRCNPPYETIVDQTGYLNRPACPPVCYPHIDMFLAGDSVLQGMGGPSVVEDLRRHTSLRLWNLSIQAYGPREKVNALLNYALPHSPRWVVVEFFAGNDVAEAIRDDVCQDGGDFRCRYNGPSIERRLARDPLYARLFDVPTHRWSRMADYAAENLTLAMTRHVLKTVKAKLKATVGASDDPVGGGGINRTPQPPRIGSPLPAGPTGLLSVAQIDIAPWVALGGSTPARVREVEWPGYITTGLAVTQREYERLSAALALQTAPPQVILLYNPAPYEIYRSIGMDLNSHAEMLYPIQREALRVFANRHGWHFLDLTEPLRRVVQHANVWLYGRYDQSHWSPEATPMVADIMARELSTIVGR